MVIVAHTRPFVIGVDTHARSHSYAILTAATGAQIAAKQFPTTSAGLNRAMAWVSRLIGGDLTALWVIEGAATYGARLARIVTGAGYEVAEAARMNARAHRSVGKSDLLDAYRIGAAVLPLENDWLRHPRADAGLRPALRVLTSAREQMSTERTAKLNALTALLRAADLGLDARRPLTQGQIIEVAAWRTRAEDLALSVARAEARRLARRIQALDMELADNHSQLEEILRQTNAAPLLDVAGIGPVTAAVAYSAWSHHGRVRDEAAFAALAGVSPIPASSGNTTRHRLNRGGDRRLNRALHMATVTRMIHDPETRTYVERRRAEGLTTKEIRRCLKRYLARRIYRTLEALHDPPATD
ncbi:IS110 family transposase [Streptomyces sp. tea 10]|nr:IS110 family transposase [Streptomyces sp. tea 10]